jgi:hypothetical protein
VCVSTVGASVSASSTVFCVETDRTQVLAVVLSMYVRRGRLPSPGEIMFCGADTSEEELSVFLLRSFGSLSYAQFPHLFCLANVHLLSYALQSFVIDELRLLLAEVGTAQAAPLVFVSGEHRQLLINTLSAHKVELEVLPIQDLQAACTFANSAACNGLLQCVCSTINGGGKTHYILSQVSEQRNTQYMRVPLRESTQRQSFVDNLNAHTHAPNAAVHVDIGHIISAQANVLLFELLVVGVVSAPTATFFRRPWHLFFVEVANSVGEQTRRSLNVMDLFVFHTTHVLADTLRQDRPYWHSEAGSWRMESNREMLLVCKVLRALHSNQFLPEVVVAPAPAGGKPAKGVKPAAKAPVERYVDPRHGSDPDPQECFDLLSRYCPSADGVFNWAIFQAFIMFMHATFEGMFEADFFRSSKGEMKQTFLQLLIATSHDFVMRAVPRQLAGVGLPRPPSIPRAPSMSCATSMDEVKGVDEADWVVVEAATAAASSGWGDDDDLPPMQRCVSVIVCV